jgi:hypothetical protein
MPFPILKSKIPNPDPASFGYLLLTLHGLSNFKHEAYFKTSSFEDLSKSGLWKIHFNVFFRI